MSLSKNYSKKEQIQSTTKLAWVGILVFRKTFQFPPGPEPPSWFDNVEEDILIFSLSRFCPEVGFSILEEEYAKCPKVESIVWEEIDAPDSVQG